MEKVFIVVESERGEYMSECILRVFSEYDDAVKYATDMENDADSDPNMLYDVYEREVY